MQEWQKKAVLVIKEVRKVLNGKDACIQKAFAAVLAGGHILIEDVPGVGKTTLAVAFSKAMALDHHRVQFTPDVMPSDLSGFNMYQKETGSFVYYPGAIMCNLFLADEINRTSPKTQSALLEVMEEGSVTVDGVSRQVPKPFIVMATQNPTGSAGTQLLPESQLDRFMVCMGMGYPDKESEMEIAKGKSVHKGTEEVQTVINAQDLFTMQQLIEQIYIHDSIYDYIVKLVQATRDNAYIELGISPRGTICCTRMAKAWAFLHGRDYVEPQDVADIFLDIGKHRLLLNTKARVAHMAPEAVLTDVLSKIRQPAAHRMKKAGRYG